MRTSISRLIAPKYLLILICAFFLLTRLYKIETIPPSLYWDEASIGYNAYSIAQSGKDEWGKFLPIHFRAFGEFKLPVYIYSVVPFVKIFGLNEFSVRIPAILFSLISIILVYLIVLKIFQNHRAALFSSFFLSISPWFFIFSRTGYEVTAGLMFFLLGFYFFLISEKKKFTLFLFAASFIFSMYSYNSFRIISPIVFIVLLTLKFKGNIGRKNLIPIFFSVLFFVLSLVPIIRLSLFDAGFARTQSFRLFPSIQQVYDLSGKPHFQLIYDRSKSVNWWDNLSLFLKNYFAHFSQDFLILKGDSNQRSQQPGFGQIYFLDIFLILFGLIYIKTHKKQWSLLLVVFLILSPIPAALFKESPHALRSLLAVPIISMIAGLGMDSLLKNRKVSIFILFLYFMLFANYFRAYIFDYSAKSAQDWQYGYKKIYTDYAGEFKKYSRVIISDQYAQPYIFALYYLKYSPESFRSEVKYNPIDKWGFSTTASFERFEFKKIDKLDIETKNTLIFATDVDRLENINPLTQIKFPDGKIAFWVYSIE